MEFYSGSFLQILQDDSPLSFDNSKELQQNISEQWDDEEDSFEVSEVTNAASSDINLADALRSINNAQESPEVQTIDTTDSLRSIHGSPEVQLPGLSSAQERTHLNKNDNLKEELKAKIQGRRKSEGIGELRITFEPPKSYALTPEERDKVQKRKHRNRLSANKSRLRRKLLEDSLRKEAEDLETENSKLYKEVKFLQTIKGLLTSKVENHSCAIQKVTSSSSINRCTKRNVTSTSMATLNIRKKSGRESTHTISRTDLNTSTACFESLTTCQNVK